MSSSGNVFALQGLPEEVVAVLLAKYSRNPGSLRDILDQMVRDGEVGAGEWHEKYTLGYGHGSVSEHAVLHLCLEDVSILASKAIEDCRLASYTEKSTRYLDFSQGRFYRPAGPDGLVVAAGCEALFRHYRAFHQEVLAFLKAQNPEVPQARLNAQTCDVVRYLLPVGTLTNLGITANARTFAHMIRKLSDSDLPECQVLADKIQNEAQKVCPTLLRHTDPSPYRKARELRLAPLSDIGEHWQMKREGNTAQLVRPARDAHRDLAASLIYRQSGQSWQSCQFWASRATQDDIDAILVAALGDRGDHDGIPREFENLTYTFEVVLDYGAYRDLQRHRMTTQLDQPLGINLGYEVPDVIVQAGLADRYARIMEASAFQFEQVGDPKVRPYCLPLAWRKRFLLTLNLRELFYLVELRSRPQGHESYRRIAIQMADELGRVHPLIARWLRTDRTGIERRDS